MIATDGSGAPADSVQVRGTIVFVHGFLDAADVWNGVVEHVPDDLNKISVDLPGMGAASDDDGVLSLDRYADIVSAVVRRAAGPVILVGQSMGAQVVELAALANPDAIAGLVLITPVPLAGVHAPEEAVASFKALGGDPAAQRKARTSLSPALSAPELDRLDRFGAPVKPGNVPRLVDIWNQGHPAGVDASAFAKPVAILRGSLDPFVTEQMAQQISDRFSNVENIVVDSGGHWLHVEQPELVARTIMELLQRPAAGSDWKAAFSERSAQAFGMALADDVVLEAVALYRPVRGRERVQQVMEAASKIYEFLEFTDQASEGRNQYLQWRAKAFGGISISGITIISRNEAGQIAQVAIHHRPLAAAMKFSATLGESLKQQDDFLSYFMAQSDLPKTLELIP
ncbi:alpha/beta fold hydrolase [Rhizorhapis suberifaciens]|uniref:Pimeloyl-ACP methyl ester carboxylesterase n=1 Tax=Rhizorhapis suberifaciens TaxID=13656 RepID=A0A840HRK8_9SPHN|nr:alpha/beta hydrolase [Rhizorhapis suberifaciens]MBB4640186.1 pimeloyl-ACP methyl ester carboxylesterase [Rhizorhapis suberifaciens]